MGYSSTLPSDQVKYSSIYPSCYQVGYIFHPSPQLFGIFFKIICHCFRSNVNTEGILLCPSMLTNKQSKPNLFYIGLLKILGAPRIQWVLLPTTSVQRLKNIKNIPRYQQYRYRQNRYQQYRYPQNRIYN